MHRENQRPTVSVVIPSFNCLAYLPDALSSIELQQVPGTEVIVIDDGSDDGTLEWLSKRRNRGITLVVAGTDRKGPAAARNLGLELARGELVAFLDADDLWFAGKLAAQLAYHREHPEVICSFTNYLVVDEDGRPQGDGFSPWERFSRIAGTGRGYRPLDRALAVLLGENPVGTSTVMINRALLPAGVRFDETLPSAEDLDFWLRLCEIGPVAFTQEMSTGYLVRPGSESSRFERRMRALDIIRDRYEQGARRQDPRVGARIDARHAAAQAQLFRAQEQHLAALRLHLRALVRLPSLQALKALLVDVRSLCLRNPVHRLSRVVP